MVGFKNIETVVIPQTHYVDSTLKRRGKGPFPCRANVEYTRFVCRCPYEGKLKRN